MMCIYIHVQEEGHEWGVNAGENPLELAPRRWRIAITQQRMVLL